MNDKIFKGLPKEQLLIGAKLCAENAEAHFKCSDEMSKLNIYGLAVSHIILGSEEAIKSVLLCAGFLNIEVNTPIEPFFRKHDPKHQVGESMYEPYKVIFGVIQLIRSIKSKNFVDIFKSLQKLLSSNNLDKEAIDWWQNANKTKNNGFYVGYVANSWLAPQDFKEADYIKGKEIVSYLREAIQIIKILKEDDYKLLNKQ